MSLDYNNVSYGFSRGNDSRLGRGSFAAHSHPAEQSRAKARYVSNFNCVTFDDSKKKLTHYNLKDTVRHTGEGCSTVLRRQQLVNKRYDRSHIAP